MNLEQIRNRQELINGLLYTLLNDTTTVVERIIGVQELNYKDKEIETPVSGLLDEMASSQNTTEDYIQKISQYNRLLCDRVYLPNQICADTKRI